MRFFIRMSEVITGTILNQSVFHIHRRFAGSLSRQRSSSRMEAAGTPLGSTGGVAVMICAKHHWILHDDSWSFALGLNWVKFGVSAVNVHDVPPKLSLAYMITVHPDGILTDDAQLSGTPLAASCEVV